MLYAYTTLTHLHKQTRNACSEKGMELVSLLFLLCIFFDMFNVSTRSCKRRPSRCLMMGIDWAQFMWTPPFVLRLLNERRLSFARWWLSCVYHDSPFGQSCNRSSSLLFFFLATGWTWFREREREREKKRNVVYSERTFVLFTVFWVKCVSQLFCGSKQLIVISVDWCVFFLFCVTWAWNTFNAFCSNSSYSNSVETGHSMFSLVNCVNLDNYKHSPSGNREKRVWSDHRDICQTTSIIRPAGAYLQLTHTLNRNVCVILTHRFLTYYYIYAAKA